MGNSTRWKKLMEWLQYLRENNIEINTEKLAKKVKEIKKGKTN